jgi:uncharacterized protein
MRLSPEILDFLKNEVAEIQVPARMYLFGSRTKDEAKGGDIDILILSEAKLERQILRNIRIRFLKKFGDTKLDIVNFTFEEKSAFKEVIMDDAILIGSNMPKQEETK